MIKLKDARLVDIAPDSIMQDERMRMVAEAIDVELRKQPDLIKSLLIWSRLDALPTGVLDHLAWQFSVRPWRDSWPRTVKARVLRNAIRDKSLLGTRGAVERAVESLGSAVEIIEWWETEPKGAPFTFDVIIDLNEIDGQATWETQDDLVAAINAAKPVRSLYQLILALKTEGVLGLYGVHRSMAIFRIDGVGVETFDPLSLRPLVWLDPSDLSTLFIDSAGTQPVQFSGDPVGLWKNKGTIGAVGNAAQPVSANRPVWANIGGGGVITGGPMNISSLSTLPSPRAFAVGMGAPTGQNTSYAGWMRQTATNLGGYIRRVSNGRIEGVAGLPQKFLATNDVESHAAMFSESAAGRIYTMTSSGARASDDVGPRGPMNTPFFIGSADSTVGHVFVFDRELTDEESTKLLTWMEAVSAI